MQALEKSPSCSRRRVCRYDRTNEPWRRRSFHTIFTGARACTDNKMHLSGQSSLIGASSIPMDRYVRILPACAPERGLKQCGSDSTEVL